MGEKSKMKAILLSAGKGTRLRPITNTLPKVMVDVGGKPCLQHNIELLEKYGIKDLAINTHAFPESIQGYFGDGKKFDVRIRYSYEPKLLGTSGALNNFKDFFDGPFFVMCGDVIHETDLRKMLDFHRQKGGLATIALYDGDQRGKGVVIFDENKRITKFIEKPEKNISNALISSGVYFFEKEILDYIPVGFSDFGYGIFPEIVRSGKALFAFEGGEIMDIGTPDVLSKARLKFNYGGQKNL